MRQGQRGRKLAQVIKKGWLERRHTLLAGGVSLIIFAGMLVLFFPQIFEESAGVFQFMMAFVSAMALLGVFAVLAEFDGVEQSTSLNRGQCAANIAHSVDELAQEGLTAIRDHSSQLKQSERSNEILRQLTDVLEQVVTEARMINGVALQTKMLAINTWVESTRGGELGTGLEAVAQLMQGLAASSANAAQQMEAFLGDAQIKVQSAEFEIKNFSQITEEASVQLAALFEAIQTETHQLNRNIRIKKPSEHLEGALPINDREIRARHRFLDNNTAFKN